MIDESFYTQIQSVLTQYFSNLDLRPMMPEIANILEYGITEQFITEGSYFGTPWPDLAESTRKQRERKGKWPGDILRFNSILFGSVEAGVNGYEVWGGTNMSYAVFHQTGTSKMPARPILPINNQLPQEMLSMIHDAVSQYIFRITR